MTGFEQGVPGKPVRIAIVTYPGMTALDAIGPYEVLRFAPGAQVRFVWHEPGPIATDSGVLLLGATHSFDETPAPDIVLVPGGPGSAAAAVDDALLDWLRRAHEGTLWTTSVCTGALVLAAAGLLPGRPATTHWLAQSALRALGADARPDERIVRDGKTITAAGVSAGIDLALWLVGETFGARQAQTAQLIIEYDPQLPYDAGHVSKASREVRRAAIAAQVRTVAEPGGFGEFARLSAAVPRLAWRSAIRRVRERGKSFRRPAT
ncbi:MULTISPECIES: DJ-1/PfpI family protein [Nocardia]|uniref:DJ-1/PfpI family protein n=1 Tax=Nocardia sp. CY15 TaxID=2608687 RepID=UPI00191663C1|nr:MULTISPECIES: DJ-1/PfpI family protein [Nocardia]